MTNPQDNGQLPSRWGGPRSLQGKRRASKNATKSGMFSVGSGGIPAVRHCPLKGSAHCRCPEEKLQDPHADCPGFSALHDRLLSVYLREPHIKAVPAYWNRVRDLVLMEIKVRMWDAWVQRTGMVRALDKGLGFHSGEIHRAALQNEIRRLSAELLLTPASRRMVGSGEREPMDLATCLAQVAKREDKGP